MTMLIPIKYNAGKRVAQLNYKICKISCQN